MPETIDDTTSMQLRSTYFFMDGNLTNYASWLNSSDFGQDSLSKPLRYATMYPLSYRITATVLHSILLFIGFFGNIVICLVVKRTRSLHTPTYCYLVSLAVADLILVCSAIPEAILSYHLYSKQWVLGHAGCSIMAFSTFLAINAGSISILAFTVERFIAICHPIQAQKVCTVTRARNIIVVVWIFVFIYCCPWLYFTVTRPLDLADVKGMKYCDYRLTRETYLIVYLADFVIFYVLPLTISIVLYCRIGYVIFRSMKGHQLHRNSLSFDSNKNLRKSSRIGPDKDLMMLSVKEPLNSSRVAGEVCKQHLTTHPPTDTRWQVIKMLIVVVVSFAILWAPYRGLLVYNSLAQKRYMNMWFVLFCKTLVYLNSTLNPFLYTVFSRKFRSAFLRILLCQKKSRREQMSSFMEMSSHMSNIRSVSAASSGVRQFDSTFRRYKYSTDSNSLVK